MKNSSIETNVIEIQIRQLKKTLSISTQVVKGDPNFETPCITTKYYKNNLEIQKIRQ